MRSLSIFILIGAVAISISGLAEADEQAKYGAMAYSPKKNVAGYAYNYTTILAAEKWAIDNCRSRAQSSDCRVIMTFQSACAAFATGKKKKYGTGLSPVLADAQKLAIESCKKNGGKKCKLANWACSQ